MAKHNSNYKQYTKLRQFYAWSGFAFWIILAPILLGGFIWTVSFAITNSSLIF